MPKLVVVFDYSGTLSMEAVAFANDDVLERQLYLSGLADFGVDSPETFWSGIVNPTWEEGSRSPIGYRRLIVDKISKEWTGNQKGSSLAALDRAAGIFVARYFSHSRIDPAWRPLLRELYKHPLITAVVATDHYAEATEAIKDQFQHLQINAVPLGAGDAASRRCFFIANSADLGYRKDEEKFWVQVREQTHWTPTVRLLLIDDFGANEAAGDPYGQEAKVAARRQSITEVLKKVFAGRAEIIPFILAGDETPASGAACFRIRQIAAGVRESLRGRGGPRV
jgi:hypothetical protein